ncbi:cytidine deaminase [Endozoicomonas sp. OPT23]|uniref:cytidine deaminase n=1 Tax=Endozoicomonas sp. OPT23 TaxID=2072845 RepID=UPI00129B4DE4|nr:cytidine deaminase [Endozoicomonas sp. OPT23]MRI33281.1 cytidine deaminase [Endozoicomonas sp. OPT23]
MQTQAVFQERISAFPAEATAILADITRQEGMLTAEQVSQLKSILDFSTTADLMVKLLPVAAAISVAPVSEFYVGVVTEGVSGNLYFGANIEFLHQPLKVTLHAEQCAVLNAWHKGEKRLVRLVVNEAPCGHCRQFLNELNSADSIEVIVQHASEGVVRQYSMEDLLPKSFGPADLGLTDALMSPEQFDLTLPEEHANDDLVKAAFEAAVNCHAPVCKSPAGVAFRLKSGKIVAGRYASNAAFNPGATAMESAMVNWRLSLLNSVQDDVVEAVMVEQPAKVTQKELAESQLKDYGVELRYISV